MNEFTLLLLRSTGDANAEQVLQRNPFSVNTKSGNLWSMLWMFLRRISVLSSDSGSDDSGSDASGDSGSDASGDSGSDASGDSGSDASGDSGPVTDAARDSGPVVDAPDSGPDASDSVEDKKENGAPPRLELVQKI
jgi:hypothetical protein